MENMDFQNKIIGWGREKNYEWERELWNIFMDTSNSYILASSVLVGPNHSLSKKYRGLERKILSFIGPQKFSSLGTYWLRPIDFAPFFRFKLF